MSKMNGRKKTAILFSYSLIMLCFFIFCIPLVGAAERIGKFTYVEGRVDVMRGGALPSVTVNVGDPVFTKDIVRTKSDSKAEITFMDNNILRIVQRSRIDISEYIVEEGRRNAVIRLPRGRVQAIVPEEMVRRISISPEANRFEIHTPYAVTGVRGTDYFVIQERNLTGVFVREGMVYVYNPRFIKEVVYVPVGYITFVDEFHRPHLPRRAMEAEARRFEKEPERVMTTPSPAEEPTRSLTDLGVIQPKVVEISTTTTLTEINRDITPPVNVPSVEVGRTSLTGSLFAGPAGGYDYMSVLMKDVVFLAPSTGQRPSIWSTNSVSGNFRFGSYINSRNITSAGNVIPLSDERGLDADFQFTRWNATSNKWDATITNGTGTLSGGSFTGPINFSGDASGAIGTNTISGTAKGVVK
jgi:hypothetical protein